MSSSFESPGFPSQPAPPAPAEEPVAAPTFAPLQPFDEIQPLQPFDEIQPLQPVEATPVESYPLQQAEPLQPTMPPPLPLLTAADPVAVEPAPATAPAAPSPEEVANLGVPLGTLIFRAGLLTEEQLEDALQEGVRSGKRLGEVLLESGLIDERDLGRLLADQKGLRFVELPHLALDPAATALLSAERAHMFAALPVGFEEGVPVVAVADPSNELVTENLRRALGRDPRLVVASRSDLHATIDRTHGAPAEEPVAEAQPEAVQGPSAEVAFTAPHPEAEPQPEVPQLVSPVAVEPTPVPAPVVTPAPEPALRPVEVAQVAPLVPETQEAAPEPEPLPVVSPEPVVADAAPEPTFSHVAEPEPEPKAEGVHEVPSALSYDVSLRLADGERVPVGSFSDPQKAREYAREVVRHLSDETDGWPFFSGRFLRPETIVSVDIVPVGEPDRWLGSSVRSNWASRLNR
jgi:MshEN domain